MKRYLIPTKVESTKRVYRSAGYTLAFDGKEYTIYADTRERAERVFQELCETGEIKLLKPNT